MLDYENTGSLGGLDSAEKESPETAKTEEPKKKRQPFAYWNVKERTYRLKLKAAGIEKLENKYRQNLMNMIDNIPPLSVMLTIIQAAMEPWEHGVDYNDVKKLYDIWIEEGNSQLELYQKVLIPIMVVSGFLPEKTAAALLEAVENA